MDISLSKRILKVKPSATLAVTARAAELKAQGKAVISLGAGEPDFDTPDSIKSAAKKAIDNGQTKYTDVAGTTELKQAVVDKFARENRLQYGIDQILVSAGGKQGFYNLVQALINPGEEVIIPAPYWVSYPDIVMLADGVPVIVASSFDQQFKITPEQLEQAMSPMTRLFVLNSPGNPSGQAYTRGELAAFGEVLQRYPDVLVITDDIYEHIIWQPPFENILNVCPELYPRCVVLNGVSKAYAMTGWRIGYAAGPAKLIKAMKTIQSQSTSNASSISQAAALQALSGDQGFIGKMVKEFRLRHDYVVDTLNAMSGVRCQASQGTFYSFPNVSTAMSQAGFADDVAFAEYLLNEALVALVPGTAFGSAGHLRLSFATSMANLREAMNRLQKVFG